MYLSLVDFKQGGSLGMAKYQRPGRSLEAYSWWCPAFHPTFASGSLWKCSLLYFCLVLQDAPCLDDVRATHIYTCMRVCATFLYSYTRSQTFIHVSLYAQTHLVQIWALQRRESTDSGLGRVHTWWLVPCAVPKEGRGFVNSSPLPIFPIMCYPSFPLWPVKFVMCGSRVSGDGEHTCRALVFNRCSASRQGRSWGGHTPQCAGLWDNWRCQFVLLHLKWSQGIAIDLCKRGIRVWCITLLPCVPVLQHGPGVPRCENRTRIFLMTTSRFDRDIGLWQWLFFQNKQVRD